VPELVESPLAPVGEGLDVREVIEGRVNEVVGRDVFGVRLKEVVEVVGMGILEVTEVEVEEELEDEDEEEVDEDVMEGVEEVEDVLSVGGLVELVEGDGFSGVLVEEGFPLAEAGLGVSNGFPLYA